MIDAMRSCALLSPGDPAAVEIVNAQVESSVLLVCEHAGQAIPQSIGQLGLTDQNFNSHIGWDIGAEGLARKMADRLGAPLIVQRFSRLVIDCNRPPDTDGSIPQMTGGIPVPGNMNLRRSDRDARRRAIFEPYDRAIKSILSRRAITAVFSIHSFTADYPGQQRPWDAGFLTRKDDAMAQSLIESLRAADPQLILAINEPYRIEDDSDWLIPQYAEVRDLRHSLIEVRNSHIVESAGQDRWAGLLSRAIQASMEAFV
jgi:predicted N-formylglutamate amidohydrolase